MSILAIDVSGNFKEGKGTSGICVMADGEPVNLLEIKARDFEVAEAYWGTHLTTINDYGGEGLEAVVMEGYRLYNHKGQSASKQANSELETPQLIGVIKQHCFMYDIPLHIQYAHEVKSRWKESVLVAKGILEQRVGNRYYFNGKQTNDHQRDALKHALHFNRYGRDKLAK